MTAARHHSSQPPLTWAASELPSSSRPARVEIDLDSLKRNFRLLRKKAGLRRIIGVVKANAYGHGAVAVSRVLEHEGVECLAVAFVDEGIELRKSGITIPILVLGGYQAPQLPLFDQFGLTAAVSSREQLDMWHRAADGRSSDSRDSSDSSDLIDRGESCSELRPNEPGSAVQSIHLKVDTGMTRVGFAPSEVDAAIAELATSKRLQLDGIFSHLAYADRPFDGVCTAETRKQKEKFDAVLAAQDPSMINRLSLHLENSAGLLHHDLNSGSLVRAGLALYGVDPAGRRDRPDTSGEPGEGEILRPVMRVTSQVIQVKAVPKGTRSGYGGTWTAPRASNLAVVPVGYADGYPHSLSNRADVLIRGSRAPVVGAVSMDMLVVDVTKCGGELGDEVVLLGKQRECEISIYELAQLASTIPYEVLAGFGLRLPKWYRSRPGS